MAGALAAFAVLLTAALGAPSRRRVARVLGAIGADAGSARRIGVWSLVPIVVASVLAAAGSKRIPALPDVPTMSETFPGFAVGSAVGLVAPAGTPPEVVDTLNRAIGKVIATPGFHQRMAAIGVDVLGTTPA